MHVKSWPHDTSNRSYERKCEKKWNFDFRPPNLIFDVFTVSVPVACFWQSFVTLNGSRDFFLIILYQCGYLKHSTRCGLSSAHWIMSIRHTKHKTQTEIWKKVIFAFLTRNREWIWAGFSSRFAVFWGGFQLPVSVEIFLQHLSWRSRYLKCSPRSGLSSALWITTVRRRNHFLFDIVLTPPH